MFEYHMRQNLSFTKKIRILEGFSGIRGESATHHGKHHRHLYYQED
jgi:hypothetical protein